ncbi:MAG: imidazolonepropionase, partial [Actinobacteria bacterium]|nr:imidazolonepropionase [Actinomycetota bacterium]
PAASAAIDLEGRAVLPGFVDSHAHLLFAGDRASEFAARMSGQPYSAGGIRSTVTATRGATDDQLAENLHRLAAELRRSGVTTFETKSGYGLTTVDESRALRIARDVTGDTTYLGAHVVPAEFEGRPDDYVALVAGGMLEACAPHAKWIDVFCDRGAFDVDQARTILLAGMAAGLAPRLHANQLQHGGGVQLAVELDAASADHCTHLDDCDIEALAGSNTVATLLPGAEFSTRSPYPDARRLLDAGATIALATDCNPGSSYTTSMSLMIALAVRDMRMTPDEAVWSATLGGAQALRRNDIGRVSIGSRADLISLNAPSHVHIAYRPGVDLIDRVWQAPLTPKVAA